MSDVTEKSGSDEPASDAHIKSGNKAAPDSETLFQKCPACGTITRDADVCRRCGRDFVTGLPPDGKAKFSRDERKVAAFISGLAALTAAGHRLGVLPPLASVVSLFAVPVIASVLCTVTWRRTRREGMAGSTKFAVFAVLSGIAAATLVVVVAIPLVQHSSPSTSSPSTANASPAQLPPPVFTAEQDQAFLLDLQRIHSPITDSAIAIAQARRFCRDLGQGETTYEARADIAAQTGMDSGDATLFTGSVQINYPDCHS